VNSCSDPYQILMVPRHATVLEIRAAFRQLIGQWHPDVAASPEAHRRAAAIIDAYRILTHPERRAQLDRRQAAAPPFDAVERRRGERRRATRPRGLSTALRAGTLAWALVATVIITGAAATEWQNANSDEVSGLIS
jgi:DnaJ-class molecular chaperone